MAQCKKCKALFDTCNDASFLCELFQPAVDQNFANLRLERFWNLRESRLAEDHALRKEHSHHENTFLPEYQS